MTAEQILSFRFYGKSIPEYMIGEVLAYFNDHILDEYGFLQAVLENHFMAAVGRADDNNIESIQAWAAFLFSQAPINAYGSPEKVKAWLAAREQE